MSDGRTHSEECWRWHGHCECAERKVEELTAENRKYREALHKIRDEPGNARDCRYYAAQALSGQD